jgi:hypothetical protein
VRDGRFVALWPITDESTPTRLLFAEAKREMHLMAEQAGVLLDGDPVIEVTENATAGLCLTAVARAHAAPA